MIITKKLTHYLPLFARQPFTIALLLSLFFSLSLTACDQAKDASISRPRAEEVIHRVEVVVAEKKPVFLTQTVSGTLEAVTKIRLYNEESARITKMPYHEGDFVKKGDLLIQLDNAILKTDVDKAKASKEQAKVDLSRLKKLLAKKIATEEEVANARTVLDLAIAEEKHQITRLQRTSVKAPIDGLITRRLYEPGDLLAPQSHIQTIIDPSKIRLKASLAERWIPLVNDGQAVSLYIDALGDKTFTAHVERVHPTISAGTHKGIVEILLDPVPDNAKIGQFVRAEIELKATNRLVIPVHAIHYEPEGAYVYRVIENENSESTAEKVFFEQGQQFGALSEALTELKINDKIVTRGYLGLRDGKKVDIANPDQLSGDTAE
jgi:membrane fusion protein (multidrug efflux system)